MAAGDGWVQHPKLTGRRMEGTDRADRGKGGHAQASLDKWVEILARAHRLLGKKGFGLTHPGVTSGLS